MAADSDMTIAITAASGQLGAAIVKAAATLVGNRNVVAIARIPENAKGLGVEVRKGSYDDRREMQKALAGVDAVLLVSGMDAPDKRIVQHRNVIEAAKAAGVCKFVYTSVQGPEDGTAFSPIVQSNRQTEQDVKDSGLAWVVGRNGIYIEPDVEYIETYKAKGEIANCAGDGKCGYTTRAELAYAYARLLADPGHDGKTYNLHGEPITQASLARFMGEAFNTLLRYRAMAVDEYRQERIAELGEFMGTIIAGIYQGIRDGHYDRPSEFEAASGRAHASWMDYFGALKADSSASR
jgi:NAD(P)H dehydrogenase (quinone)